MCHGRAYCSVHIYHVSGSVYLFTSSFKASCIPYTWVRRISKLPPPWAQLLPHVLAPEHFCRHQELIQKLLLQRKERWVSRENSKGQMALTCKPTDGADVCFSISRSNLQCYYDIPQIDMADNRNMTKCSSNPLSMLHTVTLWHWQTHNEQLLGEIEANIVVWVQICMFLTTWEWEQHGSNALYST